LPVTSDDAVLVAIMILFFSLIKDASPSAQDVGDDVHAAAVEPFPSEGHGHIRRVLVVRGQHFNVETADLKFLRRLLRADDAGGTVHVAGRSGHVVHDPDPDQGFRLRPGAKRCDAYRCGSGGGDCATFYDH
jgi:hypothetical protein